MAPDKKRKERYEPFPHVLVSFLKIDSSVERFQKRRKRLKRSSRNLFLKETSWKSIPALF